MRKEDFVRRLKDKACAFLKMLFSKEVEQLPRPEDAKKANERRLREQEQKSRAEFFAALPAFKSLIIKEVKRQYGMPFKVVLVHCPSAISERPDLIGSELVPWAGQRGWVAGQVWLEFTQEYALELLEAR